MPANWAANETGDTQVQEIGAAAYDEVAAVEPVARDERQAEELLVGGFQGLVVEGLIKEEPLGAKGPGETFHDLRERPGLEAGKHGNPPARRKTGRDAGQRLLPRALSVS